MSLQCGWRICKGAFLPVPAAGKPPESKMSSVISFLSRSLSPLPPTDPVKMHAQLSRNMPLGRSFSENSVSARNVYNDRMQHGLGHAHASVALARIR
jgi:hypothetical protein